MATNEEMKKGRWSLHSRFDSETERRLQLLSEVYGLAGLEETTARRAAIYDLASLEEAGIPDVPSTQAASRAMLESALLGAVSSWQPCC